MSRQHSFVMLDALRGVAAIAVLLYHQKDVSGHQLMPHGYLAVDFFFMLSGFVLTLAYQSKLDAGWSTWTFFKIRIARLYPLYLLGTVIGVLSTVYASQNTAHIPSLLRGTIMLVLSLFFIPTPPGVGSYGRHFFYDIVAWSLFFELLANIYHALFLRNRTMRFLCWMVLLAAPILLVGIVRNGSIGLGVWVSESIYGLARVVFSYTIGVILFRIWISGRGRFRVHPLFVALILLAVLAMPGSEKNSRVFDIAMVCLVFPPLILAGASSNPTPTWNPVLISLGALSYPLYVLHLPIQDGFYKIWQHYGGQPDTMFQVGCCLLVIGLSLLLGKVYDQPARKWLRSLVSG